VLFVGGQFAVACFFFGRSHLFEDGAVTFVSHLSEMFLLDLVWSLVWTVCALFGLVSLGMYLVPVVLYSHVLGPQDLKKKYGAEWALVTGCVCSLHPSQSTKLKAQQNKQVDPRALARPLYKSLRPRASTSSSLRWTTSSSRYRRGCFH